MIFQIDRIDDPRVAGFRDVRDRDLVGRQGLIMAEGEVLLTSLLSVTTRVSPLSILLSQRQHERLAPRLEALDPEVPVYVAAQDVLDQIAGFHLHRGILALANRPCGVAIGEWSGQLAPAVLAVGIGNHDNMGGLFRNAAAFGACGLVLDATCCDPFYRKALRVSVGASLRMPFAEGLSAYEALDALEAAGFQPVAMSPSGEVPLHMMQAAGPVAIVMGSEGPGLPSDLLARCATVRIPMAAGFDSLNVATASALALDHFTRHLRS